MCEGLGFESGLDKKFHEAPVFYWLYTLLIVLGAGVLLVPRFPLVHIMVLSQVVNGVVLPFVLIFMLLLTNDRELMGEHVNSRGFNIVAWITVVVMIVLTLAMVITRGKPAVRRIVSELCSTARRPTLARRCRRLRLSRPIRRRLSDRIDVSFAVFASPRQRAMLL